MEIWQELELKTQELDISVRNLRKAGTAYANAYRKYRILVAQELLRLKNEGMPVTIAYDIARGNEEVANAKFEELKYEAIYKANQESINSIKLQIKVLQEQQKQEWGIAGKE